MYDIYVQRFNSLFDEDFLEPVCNALKIPNAAVYCTTDNDCR